MIWFLILKCISGCIFGRIVNRVIENKGYTQDWFWWGFFFELYALIVACLLPKKVIHINEDENYFGSDESVVAHNASDDSKKMIAVSEVSKGWTCPLCGEMNAGYTGTCGCGYNTSGNI
ncbi:MAG: hypothetical protein HDR25_02010 [Lachnospiraceae bacterium]|nr:hypothetical protein [Lachnospiraceae bacterium]